MNSDRQPGIRHASPDEVAAIRGRGASDALIERVAGAVARQGCNTLDVTISPANEASLAAFRRIAAIMGWSLVDQREVGTGAGFSETRFRHLLG